MPEVFKSPLRHEEISADRVTELMANLFLCDSLIDVIFAKVYSWSIDSGLVPMGQRLLEEVVELHQSVHCHFGYTTGRQIPYNQGRSAIKRCYARLHEIHIDARALALFLPPKTEIEKRQAGIRLPLGGSDTTIRADEAPSRLPAAGSRRYAVGRFCQAIKSEWQKIRDPPETPRLLEERSQPKRSLEEFPMRSPAAFIGLPDCSFPKLSFEGL